MGFYRIIEIGRMRFNWALITALIERWRPETHTFHLPIGEATITLQDVEVLYGLPVDGMPISLPIAMRSMSRDDYWDMLQELTGFRPEDEIFSSGASRFSLTPIRQYLEVLHPIITNDTEELLDELPYYSWSADVLAYMYRSMCRASMGTQRDVCGFLPLLQVWAWEQFLQVQPPLPQLPPNVELPELPLSRRLAAPFTDPVSTTDVHDAAHPAIRRRLDDDDPDSVPKRDGMRLRLAAALKHTGCRTH
ncbi:serine/threonine-protein phosphatase 7 long form homolog [Nicotiana sylvestris]|uniref:serine/threonine-protein phosphatase 7 long form homolog n=1 Tax=Nicotiana sylvestris TaxID=4096 RepID=UPI00388C9287